LCGAYSAMFDMAGSTSPDRSTKAVFLDALGTLVDLEPPWIHLRAAVADEISDERLVKAVRAEMAYYKAHSHEGRDAASLADLRRRCAAVLSDALGAEVTVEELVDSVRMRPFDDASPALERLRSRGLTLVVVSNWDCSLGEVLERCGLAPLLDGAVSSAEAGAWKPDAAIFAPALEIAACEPAEALHVGDTFEDDVEAARAAAIPVLLIDRDGRGERRDEVASISSLSEIEEHLRR
jgi:putative hydrolase of the HAD superfamily